MPFIGNQPALSYTSFAKQDFTTSATTSYTLDNPVTNENEIALFINFVRQEPTTAYTASGTSLTLTSATSASDDMYCVFLGKAVQTVNPPSGSVGTSQLDSSLDFSSKTITLASNMKNTPAFYAYKSSGQSVATDTNTKVTFETELFDSDGKFLDSRFTPTVAGYYLVSSTLSFTNHPAGKYCQVRIVKNGADVFSEFNQNQFASSDADTKTTATFMIYLDADDYLEIFIRHNAGQNETTRSGNECRFMAQKIIGA